MYEALRARDIYLVAGCAVMGSAFLACGTLVGDLLLAAVDPRVRDEGAR
jgi:peptide/nickel transport system permease protein